MKNVLLFLLGIILVIGISATTNSIMTIKPAKPVSAVVFTYGFSGDYSVSVVKSKILEYYKQGYIIKDVTSYDGVIGIVVMEKY